MTTRKGRQLKRHCRSCSPFSEGLEPRIALSGPTFVVTSNADAGQGTLRRAIQNADQTPVSTIDFELQPGSLTINLVDALPLITSTVTIDGTSQPGYSGTPLVTVTGSKVASPGTGFDFVQGSSGSVIQGLEVTGFNSAAIMVDGASNVTIGGAAAGQGNLITDNFQGIAISGAGTPIAPSPGTSDIAVEGNFIGTDATSTVARPNGYGVFITAATNNTIGGSLATDRNIISGNTTAGVVILGASGNTVVGNDIGTNAAGDGPVPNGTGVEISGSATGNTVGGTIAGDLNLISGNTTAGIAISGVGTSANLVAGNFIGTGASGHTALANGIGVLVSGGTATTIGGTASGAGNVISGNLTAGINLSGTSVSGTQIEGDEIGTDPAGTTAIANGSGVEISGGATGNLVGGTLAADRNIISGNSTAGVGILGTSGNTIAGNYIGTNAAGNGALANGTGVEISAGAMGNTIGGTMIGDLNLIAGNTTAGIAISGTGTSANLVAANFIGTDASGQIALANGIGVLASGGTATTIGGTTSGAGNVISGNITAGIELSGGAVSGTHIVGNRIGTNPPGTAAVVHPGQASPLQALQNTGVAIIGSQGNAIGGTTVQSGNLISGNYVGVMLATIAGSSNPNVVLGNLIGTDASGAKSLGNIVGVYINGASGIQLGGTIPGSANIISGNSSVGVEIYGSGSSANLIQGNTIGLAENGQSALRGSRGLFVQSVGVFIQAASGNVIGGSAAGAGNVISGNESAGVFILSRAGISRGNSIQGNSIGLAENGSPGPGNDGYGILLDNAPNNPIGRAGAAANRFGRNGIANTRNYVGPQTASLPHVSASRSANHATVIGSLHPRAVAVRMRRHG